MNPYVRDLRRRSDGWNPARQRSFLEALANTGSVARAAATVGLSRASAYALRRRPGAEAFAAAWDAAHHLGLAAAKAPAITAVSRPVVRRGRIVAIRTVCREQPDRVGLRAIRAAVARLGPASFDSTSVNFRPRADAGNGASRTSTLSTSGGLRTDLASTALVP